MKKVLLILTLILLSGCSVVTSSDHIEKITCISEGKGLKFVIYNYISKEKLSCEKGSTFVDNSKASE